jgi:hypothetical protein
MQKSSLRPEHALTSPLLRREALQLGVVAVATLAVRLFVDSRPALVAAGIVSLVAGALAAIALIVAWRASGRGVALLVYAAAIVLFALLAALNLRG